MIRDRNVCSPKVEISIPSIEILPPADSMILNKLNVRDDFPAPVRPTMPTWEFIENLVRNYDTNRIFSQLRRRKNRGNIPIWRKINNFHFLQKLGLFYKL